MAPILNRPLPAARARPAARGRVATLVARADRAWAWLAGAYARRPATFVTAAAAVAFVVRLAATPFDVPANLDVHAYALKAREIAAGDLTPIRTHAIGWSLLLAPFVWLVRDAPMMTVLNATRIVASAVDALALLPFAVLARETLDPRARPLALAFCPFALLLVRMAVRGFSEPLLTLLFVGTVAGVLVGRRSRSALVAGACAAGLACWVHPTGVVVLAIAALLAAVTGGRGRRVAALAIVAAIATVVAAPAAIQRARAFDGPFDYGANTRFFIENRSDVWSPHVPAPGWREYLASQPTARILERFVVRGAGATLWDFATDVVHAPVAPFVAYGAWQAVRAPALRPILVALGVFLLSWMPVYELYGTGRHLSPALPLALILAAAGIEALARARRHAGVWMLAAAVAFAGGESVAAGVQRQRALQGEEIDGLVWGRWAAEHVRGRLALSKGHELVMMHVPDARIGGADIFTMSAPRTGLGLIRPGHFTTLDEAFAWMRGHGVSHLLVDALHDAGTSYAPLLSASDLPPFLVERYASAPGSRWPVRVFEIRWERYEPGRVDRAGSAAGAHR